MGLEVLVDDTPASDLPGLGRMLAPFFFLSTHRIFLFVRMDIFIDLK
jgi:hypothetical protein